MKERRSKACKDREWRNEGMKEWRNEGMEGSLTSSIFRRYSFCSLSCCELFAFATSFAFFIPGGCEFSRLRWHVSLPQTKNASTRALLLNQHCLLTERLNISQPTPLLLHPKMQRCTVDLNFLTFHFAGASSCGQWVSMASMLMGVSEEIASGKGKTYEDIYEHFFIASRCIASVLIRMAFRRYLFYAAMFFLWI